MYRTLNIHHPQYRGEKGIIKIKFWRFPKTGGATQEDIKTDCGYVAITQQEGFRIDNISVGFHGELLVDINIEIESGKYVAKLKGFPDSDPPFQCLQIEWKT